MWTRRALIGLLAVFGGLGSSPAAERPNILYILCDDLGYGDVGAFFQNERAAKKDPAVPHFATPRLDTLARDGVMLKQHYCGAPVCAPSRASFLTGLTQGHANVRDNQFDKALADTLTVGSVLRAGGYATAAIGKWGLQGKRPAGSKAADWEAYPTRRGFDFYFGYVRHKDGHFHYPKEEKREVWENGRELSSDLDLCYTTDLFTARAKKWIVDHLDAHKEQPFFLFLAYDTPHAVLQNPPCAYPAGGGVDGGLRWTGTPHAMTNAATGTMDGWMHPDLAKATWDHDRNPSTAERPWPEVQKRYANGVRRIDEATGDLLKLLDDLGIADNTLVVFTSDNGPSKESYLKAPFAPTFFAGYGPFTGIKRDTLEGGLREPTLVRWPRHIPAGRVDEHPSGQWDWLATFAEAAGLPAPAASDGRSLLPLLTGKGERSDGQLYVEYSNGARTPNYADFPRAHRGRKRGQMQVVFADGYKGVRYQVKSAGDPFEIYDLRKDPSESKDLGGTLLGRKLQPLLQAEALRARMPDPSATRPYDRALVAALADDPETPEGVRCTWYRGQWPWMPDFRNLPASGESRQTDFAVPAEAAEANGLAYEGYIHARSDGDHLFTIEGEGESMLFVHNCRVIDEARGAPSPTRTGTIRLAAGWHTFRLYHRPSAPGKGIRVSVKPAGGELAELKSPAVRQSPKS